MKKLMILAGIAAAVTIPAFRKRPQELFAVPAGWPKPVYNFRRNPMTPERIALGRALFYEPLLSADNTISCSSCHLQNTAFTHIDHDLSHGIYGRIGTRNAPALMNLAWSSSFMWDGSVNHLDMQALAPISNHAEMDEQIAHVALKLRATTIYPALFYAAFSDSAITGERVLQSLSQFMLTLVSANARYDKIQRGADTFTAREAAGYKLFRQHCASCHTEPLFTNGGFENNGLPPDPSLRDIGLMQVTHRSEDSLRFKVPTLRNIALSYPYMHDGRFKTLSQVLNYYIMGVRQSPTLNPRLSKGIYLNNEEKGALIAFLLTLTDKEFLSDPRFSYPGK